MSEQNKVTARRLLEEVLSRGGGEEVEQIVAADYRDHDPSNEVDTQGADGLREEFDGIHAAFDVRFTVEDQLADGNEVASRWIGRGRHRAEFEGIAPTGREFELTGMVIFRFGDDGKIEEGWWNWDTLGLMRVIGAIPARQPA